MGRGIVIVGAGFAGATTAIALRAEGYEGVITMVGAETAPPYNRPPLSKTYLKSDGTVDELFLRADEFWADNGIELRTGVHVTRIDRSERTIMLDDDSLLPYCDLVLATGAEARGLETDRPVLQLRVWEDAVAIRESLREGQRVAIIGGGFIGLELAAAAATAGAKPFIVEAAPRLLERALSRETAEFLRTEHERHGVTVHLGRSVTAVTHDGILLDDGRNLPADVVIVGIGVLPRVGLAIDAGLEVDNGIHVDGRLRTSDPHIWAVGDCSSYTCTATGRRLRVESIQNATDQARYVARAMLGSTTEDYVTVPWFWTEQYGKKLLIAGIAEPNATSVLRGDPATGSFSVCRFNREGRCTAVESIGRPVDHLAARKLLAADGAGIVLSAEHAADVSRPLNQPLSPARCSGQIVRSSPPWPQSNVVPCTRSRADHPWRNHDRG